MVLQYYTAGNTASNALLLFVYLSLEPWLDAMQDDWDVATSPWPDGQATAGEPVQQCFDRLPACNLGLADQPDNAVSDHTLMACLADLLINLTTLRGTVCCCPASLTPDCHHCTTAACVCL